MLYPIYLASKANVNQKSISRVLILVPGNNSFQIMYFSKLRGKWRKKTADTDFDKKQGTHATMQNQLFFFFFFKFPGGC